MFAGSGGGTEAKNGLFSNHNPPKWAVESALATYGLRSLTSRDSIWPEGARDANPWVALYAFRWAHVAGEPTPQSLQALNCQSTSRLPELVVRQGKAYRNHRGRSSCKRISPPITPVLMPGARTSSVLRNLSVPVLFMRMVTV